MSDMYKLVAQKFAERINEVFASEEKLEESFRGLFTALPFNRTDHWQNVLRAELNKIWQVYGPVVKAQAVQHDTNEILQELYFCLDYNLFTQVLLNLQTWAGWGYAVGDAKQELEAMQKKYEGKELTPFAPKAKMAKDAITAAQREYNVDLSSLKALKIISEFTPMNSFRVSPKGSTPALADSRNLSVLGVGADKYARTISALKLYYISWAVGTTPLIITPTGQEGEFTAAGIEYPFQSRSGGETLNEVLFARMITAHIFRMCHPQTVLPRMNSVTIIAPQAADVAGAFKELVATWTVLEFHEGTRVKPAGDNRPEAPGGVQTSTPQSET